MTGSARIHRVSGPLVEVDDLTDPAMNDLITLGPEAIPAEIVGIRDGRVTAQAYEYTGGLTPGAAVRALRQPLSARLSPALLGGVFDGLLRPLTGAPTWLTVGGYGATSDRQWLFRPTAETGTEAAPGAVLGTIDLGPIEYRVLAPPSVSGTVNSIVAQGYYSDTAIVATVAGIGVSLAQTWPVRLPRPTGARYSASEPLRTGQRAVDLLFPVAKGSTVGIPGGFGTGKTMLLQQVAKWCDADVIVYVGCGERGNEMAEIVEDLFALEDPRTGGRLADRTVVIANTSNMPMMARESSVHSAVTVAEFFRDMGYHTVVIADSTSRWAEALREFASRLGTFPVEEGYPADLASALAAFYERAAAVRTLGGRTGSVTILGAVSPPGGDLSEPVTAYTERFVRARWTLDRDLAYARHYPAISWTGSFSHDIDAIAVGYTAAGDPDWERRRRRVAAMLAESDRLTSLIELVGADTLPPDQRVILLAGRLLREGVLQQNALSPNDARCSMSKTVALVDAVLAVIDRCVERVTDGVSPERIEAVDFGPLVRAREAAGPEDTGAVERSRDELLNTLGELR